MKLLFRLSLTILSLLLILLASYLILPSLAAAMARYSLNQQGFTELDIQFGPIGFESTLVEHARLSNSEFNIELTGLKAGYQLTELLSGKLDTLQIDKISLSRLPAPPPDNPGVNIKALTSPELLAGFLNLAWHEMMPMNSLSIQNLSLYAENGSLSLTASAELSKQAQHIHGEIKLIDSRDVRYETRLKISPEIGVDLQLYSKQAHPLSIKLKAMPEVNGLSGMIRADLAQIADITGQLDSLGGSLTADVSYYSSPEDAAQTHFSVSAKATQLEFSDAQIKDIQADIKGHFMQQDNGYRLAFSPESQITMVDIQQGLNTLEKMELKLPRSLTFTGTEINLASDQGAESTLSKLRLDDIELAQARLDNIDFTGYGTDENSNQCRFKFQLTTALIKIADKRIEPAPVQISGSCPERDELKWSIKAESKIIAYQDTSYTLSLSHCVLQFGNSEQGKRLDANPAELGGTFECVSSPLSEGLISDFRFNPFNSAGRADFSISGITPDDETPLIGSVLKDWAQPFEIVSGSLSAQGSYRWWKNKQDDDREKLTIDLQVMDAGGHYEGILFSGLNYRDSIELLPSLNSADFSTLSVEHIDIAVPVSGATANIRFSPSPTGELPVLSIENLALVLLDGKVSASKLNIDLNADRQELIFSVEGLDLAQIIAVQQLDGLSATGRLDGSVPVSITPEGITIIGGKIVAQDPGGRIQYLSAGGAAEAGKFAAGSELVLKILEDLNYDSLNVDVDYDVTGELRMKLAIKGKSPRVDAHRPIHFNLNLEQNLLTLLKGLRYAEGINEDIDNSVQKYFKEQNYSVN